MRVRHLIIVTLALASIGAGEKPATKPATRAAAAAPAPAGVGTRVMPAVSQRKKPGAEKPEPARVVQCGKKLDAPGTHPFRPGEELTYDLDVMGVRAGRLVMGYTRPDRTGAEITAEAESNTFFENVRQVWGKATSFADPASLRPRRYREDATEDGVRKWAEVVFEHKRSEVDIHYAIGERERRLHYPMSTGPHDVLTVVYYLRTLPLEIGQDICIDIYGNRRVWRLSGKVDGEEWVSTPSGKYKTWRLSGIAQRIDLPRYVKEIHLWISQDEDRLPVAVVSEIDLGPVRAILAKVDGPGFEGRKKPDYSGGTW